MDVGTPLGLDFDMGVKLSGARFTVMQGGTVACTVPWRTTLDVNPGARLHRVPRVWMR